MNYEQLLTAADQEGLLVKEQPLTEHDGLIRGSRIAIRKDIETQAEKSCVLAEEIVKERIEGGANEKAVWRLFINCPFVCINFDFFWLNKARQLYMDF